MKFKSWIMPIGIVMGIIFLYQITSNKNGSVKFEDLALGKETTSLYLSKADGRVIHCSDLDNLNICLEDYQNIRVNTPIILWLGNSQLHAVNQFSPGEETAAPELHRRFFDTGNYFLTLSQPNASLQEHYLFFAYLLDNLPIKTLVLPLVFDDMREEGIRMNLSDALSDKNTAKLLNVSKVGRSIINTKNSKDAANYDLAALKDTPQKQVESVLNKNLKILWPLWAERPSLRGKFFNYLFQIRNTVFQINPSSIRNMIPGRYAKNIQSLSALLDLAFAHQVKVMLYIAPLRNDVQIPYDLNEYTSFKDDVSLISKKKSVTLLDLEGLVPNELWGNKESTSLNGNLEFDFMHFQEGGHRLLAEALFRGLTKLDVSP